MMATAGRQVLGRVEDNASAWGLSTSSAWSLLVAPFAGGILVAATLVRRDLYRFVTAEDSVLEWPQFFAIGAASFVLAALAWRLFGDDHMRLALLFGVLALGSFVVAGEEISWGQRLLGLTTPSALAGVNHQGELNIHNIGVIQRAFNLFEVGAGLYGMTVPIVATVGCLRLDRWPLGWLSAPPLALIGLFFMPFTYRALRLLLTDDPRFRGRQVR